MKAFSLALTLLLALAVNSSVTAQEEQSAAKSFEQLQKFNRFYRYLDATYVDQVDMEPLVEDAIRSMLEDLDPHSVYLDKEEMQKHIGIGKEMAKLDKAMMARYEEFIRNEGFEELAEKDEEMAEMLAKYKGLQDEV